MSIDSAFYTLYDMACQRASDKQGVTALSDALQAMEVGTEIHQTGGFTMCVYIRLSGDAYIYANAEGYEFRDEIVEGEHDPYYFGDDYDKMSPETKAEIIVNKIKEKRYEII